MPLGHLLTTHPALLRVERPALSLGKHCVCPGISGGGSLYPGAKVAGETHYGIVDRHSKVMHLVS